MHATASPAEMVRVPASILRLFRGAVVRGRAPAEAVGALREVGYELGEPVFALLEERAARLHPGRGVDALSPEEFWGMADGLFREMGWGGVSHRDPHPGVGELTLSGWFEAGGAPPAGCHLGTGVVADLLTRAAGREVAVMEVPGCPADGCRLLFGAPETLGAVYEGMRGGLSADAAMERLG